MNVKTKGKSLSRTRAETQHQSSHSRWNTETRSENRTPQVDMGGSVCIRVPVRHAHRSGASRQGKNQRAVPTNIATHPKSKLANGFRFLRANQSMRHESRRRGKCQRGRRTLALISEFKKR